MRFCFLFISVGCAANNKSVCDRQGVFVMSLISFRLFLFKTTAIMAVTLCGGLYSWGGDPVAVLSLPVFAAPAADASPHDYIRLLRSYLQETGRYVGGLLDRTCSAANYEKSLDALPEAIRSCSQQYGEGKAVIAVMDKAVQDCRAKGQEIESKIVSVSSAAVKQLLVRSLEDNRKNLTDLETYRQMLVTERQAMEELIKESKEWLDLYRLDVGVSGQQKAQETIRKIVCDERDAWNARVNEAFN